MICQCPACTPTPAPTYTEEHRHACEVRMIANLPNKEARVQWLHGHKGIAERRGLEAVRRIIDSLREMKCPPSR